MRLSSAPASDMKAINPRHFLIGLTMLAAAGLALALTPRQKVADQGSKISLEAMIPVQFGEWKLEDANTPIIGGPGVKAQLDKIYSQMLSRTYINGKGELIMLSIVYSSDQGQSTQVHRPEVCYPAQGFQVGSTSKAVIDAGGTELPVMKLVATQGQRIEPITYWVMIGDSIVRGSLEQSLARWKYGLTGKIPFGIVIRVSTISTNEFTSFLTEELFLRDMLVAMQPKHRKILTGTKETKNKSA
jgi:EpsI family protein